LKKGLSALDEFFNEMIDLLQVISDKLNSIDENENKIERYSVVRRWSR